MLSCRRTCREPRCGQPASKAACGFCPEHAKNNSFMEHRAFQYRHDAVAKMYGTVRWTRFRTVLLAQNPICSRIIKGVQCTRPSRIGHHLISPRVRPDLFVEATNVIALCEHCHPTDEGTPLWRPLVDYAPTEFEISIG